MREPLEITIWNAEGAVVVHERVQVETCSQEQIDDAVYMVERGTPAYLAMMLACQPRRTRAPKQDKDARPPPDVAVREALNEALRSLDQIEHEASAQYAILAARKICDVLEALSKGVRGK